MTRAAARAPAAVVVALVLAAGAAMAQADPAASAPEAVAAGPAGETMPRLTVDEVLAKIETAGYHDPRAVEFAHGRYEVKARDSSGRKILLLVDPMTGGIRARLSRQQYAAGSRVPLETIVRKVKAAGFAEIFLVERANALYQVQTRDREGQRIELFVHPKTGELLRHPKTGELLRSEVEEAVAAENVLTIEKIVDIVKEAGYPTVYGVANEHTVYYVHAHDGQGRMSFLYLDPVTGALLKDR